MLLCIVQHFALAPSCSRAACIGVPEAQLIRVLSVRRRECLSSRSSALATAVGIEDRPQKAAAEATSTTSCLTAGPLEGRRYVRRRTDPRVAATGRLNGSKLLSFDVERGGLPSLRCRLEP